MEKSLFTAKASGPIWRFSYSMETTAPATAIWKIWTDVENWKRWDTGLKHSRMEGVFSPGARGRLIPDSGPEVSFVLIEVNPETSYTLKTSLPMGGLEIRRHLSVEKNGSKFTHSVRFTGPGGLFFALLLGARYRRLLPGVMEKIRQLAEKEEK